MNGRALGLFTTSAAATAGYLAVSFLVESGRTRRKDARARKKTLEHATPRAKRLAETTGHVGKWYMHVPLSVVGGLLLAKRGRYAAATSIAGSSLLAATLSRALERAHDHRTPPPGKKPTKQSYPSNHAMETTATSLTSSWVLARERVAPSAATAPLAVLVSLVSGLGRLVLDRHWSTDSIAGYLAGIALGSACAGGYELLTS